MQTKTWRLICSLCIASVFVCAVVLLAAPALAKVEGACSDCHTMHNSQGGIDLYGTPYSALTKGDCVGCHTGINIDGAVIGNRGNNIPYVYNTGVPTYGTDGTTGNTLAGGHFYYVTQDNSYGHNVAGIADPEGGQMNAPPGFGIGRAAEDGSTPALGAVGNWDTNQLTCGGTYGCHGTHAAGTDSWGAISGGHHTNASGPITVPGTGAEATAPKGYRFLVGIKGYEDPDHEYKPTTSAHNQYKGVDSPGQIADTSTISYFCAECHGQFHNALTNLTSGLGSPWLRHPTDLDLGSATGTEYAGYNDGNAAYNLSSPVGSADVSAVLPEVTTSKPGNDTAIVTCISCHRAHATPYADILRWNYGGISAAGGDSNAGCFVCHTTKDDL
jgi:hypothetical protein